MISRRHSFGIVALAFAALGCSLPSIAAEKARVLVYSGSTGFRHDSIPAAVEALKSIGAKAGYVVDATEDPEVFTADKLKAYKGVVPLHAAGDSHYHWPWYGQMIGGYFERHPKGTPKGVLTVVDAKHPATA